MPAPEAFVAVNSEGLCVAICALGIEESGEAQQMWDWVHAGLSIHPTTLERARLALYRLWPSLEEPRLMPAPEPQAEPMPTLARIAAWHVARSQPVGLETYAELLQRSWHEAAARQIEALAATSAAESC